MIIFDSLERADVSIGEAAAALRDNRAVRVLGWASELADQPQLITFCIGTIVAGALRRNAMLTSTGIRMLAAELLATGAKNFVKHRVDRTRPQVPADGGSYKLARGDDRASRMSSFPSGHTAGAVAVAGAIASGHPQHRAAVYSAAAVIAVIQVPRCKHYPADLAAGALIGLAAGAAASALIPGRHR